MHNVEVVLMCLCRIHSGASENVAKTNWRLVVWLLLRMTGLRKVILSRLPVGHTHFDVDQRHSVFARFLLGILGLLGSTRKDVHSLGIYLVHLFSYVVGCVQTCVCVQVSLFTRLSRPIPI